MRWFLALSALATAGVAALTTEDWAVNLSSSRDLAAWAQFVEYAIDYEKEYRASPNDAPLVQRRFQAFRKNLDRIAVHNAKYARGEVSFELGVNALADLTDAEYRQMLGYRHARPDSDRAVATFSSGDAPDPLPDSWDWREHDAVAPIKNQGQCGSCWAFSAVAAMEGAYAIHTGHLESFSEQEIVDCTMNGTYTCNRGGEMKDGYEEVIQHHRGVIEREADYPYTAQSKGVCKADDSKGVGHFSAYVNVTVGDEKALQAAVATKGVAAVAIDASSFTFQLYRHGVYDHASCSNRDIDLDHGVAAVGYGVLKTKPFWLVKNSWGTSWGMHGYIMMSRNKKNQCGIATDASYPIISKKSKETKTEKTESWGLGLAAAIREQSDDVVSIM